MELNRENNAAGAVSPPEPGRRRPWGDTPVCRYCGSPSTVTDKSGALLCASCAERLRLLRIIKRMLKRRCEELCGEGGTDSVRGIGTDSMRGGGA